MKKLLLGTFFIANIVSFATEGMVFGGHAEMEGVHVNQPSSNLSTSKSFMTAFGMGDHVVHTESSSHTENTGDVGGPKVDNISSPQTSSTPTSVGPVAANPTPVHPITPVVNTVGATNTVTTITNNSTTIVTPYGKY